jgi:RNA-directed DNA polymerase
MATDTACTRMHCRGRTPQASRRPRLTNRSLWTGVHSCPQDLDRSESFERRVRSNFLFASRLSKASMTLTDAIRREADKLIRRHQKYAAALEDNVRRVERRSGVRPPKQVLLPSYWALEPGFNPYHVRSHAEGIAYGIQKALAARTYRPRPAVQFDVPKPGGGTRCVSVFQVADNAISRLVLKQLLAKNSTRFSGHCYAYRTDLTLHDAVLDISSDIRGMRRVFVAEFDFRAYFDSISHDHRGEHLRTEGSS